MAVGEELERREEERFLDWFAGFVAGEGCFVIRSLTRGRKQFRTDFLIGLRDDDLKILLEIQEMLRMGIVRRFHYEYSGINANPGAQWSITRHIDCQNLVEIFDNHPLRARKQEDFEIWRMAVAENRKSVKQRNLKKMKFLMEKLKLVRSYQGKDEIDEELLPDYQEVIQLALPGYEEEED